MWFSTYYPTLFSIYTPQIPKPHLEGFDVCIEDHGWDTSKTAPCPAHKPVVIVKTPPTGQLGCIHGGVKDLVRLWGQRCT